MRIPSGSPPSRQRGFLNWIPEIVGLGSSLLGGGASILGGVEQMESGDVALARAEANAQNIEAETEEAARRLQMDQAQERGQYRTIIAASGVTLNKRTSARTYMKALKDEQQREYDWLLEAGQSRADAARLVGVDAHEEARARGTGSILGGVGEIIGGVGDVFGIF